MNTPLRQPTAQRLGSLLLGISALELDAHNVDAFLAKALALIRSDLQGERGGLFIRNPRLPQLHGVLLTGVEGSERIVLPEGAGIVGETLRQGKVLLIQDAYLDPRFYPAIDVQTGYKTRCILAAPLCVPEGAAPPLPEPLGVLEILNPVHGGNFSEDDAAILASVASLIALRLREFSSLESLLLKQETLEKELSNMRGYPSSDSLNSLVGKSPCLIQLKRRLASIAPYDSTVLILGESGTGKEKVAQCLHSLSGRSKGPFVAINCASIPESLQEAEFFGIEAGVATGVNRRSGRFEQAQGGTLFLDEVGELSPAAQAALLRVIQERVLTRVGGQQSIPLDIRLIAATHRDLTQKSASEKTFREDLYYRLNVISVEVPPLRDRPEDIPLLAEHFLHQLNQRYGTHPPRRFAPEVLRHFLQQNWPGNVRQLQNAVERLFVCTPALHNALALEVSDAQGKAESSTSPPAEAARAESPSAASQALILATQGRTLAEVVFDLEAQLLERALAKHSGNKTRAAEELGLSREGLRKMLLRHKAAS